MILALSGYSGSGKDTIGRILVERGWERRSIGDRVREFLEDQNPDLRTISGCDMRTALKVADGWDALKADEALDLGVRRLLQDTASAGRREGRPDPDPEHWIRPLLWHIPADRGVVITDVRHPGEHRAVQRAGGFMVRVTRPGHGPLGDLTSERWLDDLVSDMDAHITTGCPMHELVARVDTMLEALAITAAAV